MSSNILIILIFSGINIKIIITQQSENIYIAVLNNLYLTSKFFYSNLIKKIVKIYVFTNE